MWHPGGSVVSKSTTERRAHARVDHQLEIEGTQHPDGAVARMVSHNLSTGGVCCTSSVDFPEMTRLAVRLMLPASDGPGGDGEAVDAEAVVVRRRPLASSVGNDGKFELALFFTHVEDEHRERLQEYLRDRA